MLISVTVLIRKKEAKVLVEQGTTYWFPIKKGARCSKRIRITFCPRV